MLKARRVKPAEEFLHQVEFATQFPDEVRQQRLPEMSLFVRYSVDVISFLILICLAAATSMFCVLQKVRTYFGGALKLKTM
jgi:Na+-transporting NADH:ubiquinone oxidoreductase subunit NqrB